MSSILTCQMSNPTLHYSPIIANTTTISLPLPASITSLLILPHSLQISKERFPHLILQKIGLRLHLLGSGLWSSHIFFGRGDCFFQFLDVLHQLMMRSRFQALTGQFTLLLLQLVSPFQILRNWKSFGNDQTFAFTTEVPKFLLICDKTFSPGICGNCSSWRRVYERLPRAGFVCLSNLPRSSPDWKLGWGESRDLDERLRTKYPPGCSCRLMDGANCRAN